MGKFSDLTDDQGAFLSGLVRATGGLDYETLWLHRAMGSHCSLFAIGRRTNQQVMEQAPFSDAFYVALHRLGYIELTRENGVNLRLTRRAYDYAAYAEGGKFPRMWADLVYDLGHDDTLRSRLIWALGTMVASVFVTRWLSHLWPVSL